MRGKRLTIFIGERDQYRHDALYLAILRRLKAAGLAGATVTRGIAGFGAHSQVKTINILQMSLDMPLVITVADSAERIAAIVPEISAMMAGGTITLDDTEILFSSAAFQGGLPDVAVSEVMRTEVATVRPDTPVREVVARLVAGDFSGLPVVGDDGTVVGFVDDGDLLGKHLTALSASEHRALDPALLAELLHALDADTTRVADVMRRPAPTVAPETSLRDAAHRMHVASVKHLPVVDAGGKLVGVLGRLDVLRSIASGYARRAGEHLPPLPQESARVADVMDRDVPSVPDVTPLTDVVERLLDTPARELVVVDGERRPRGIVTPSDILARIDASERPGLLLLLKSRFSEAAAREVRRSTGQRAGDIMTAPVVSIVRDAPVIEALSLMVARHIKHLTVVDADGRLCGGVSRAAVLASSLSGAA